MKGKVAIVTGTSSGIGLATARLLSKNGVKVVLAARSSEVLSQLEKEIPNSLTIMTDMTKEKDIQQMVEETMKHFKAIDILVNNAGRGYDAPIEDIDAQLFTQLFQLDLLGPTLAMKYVIPYMKKQKNGVIVNISSGTALMAIPQMGPYASLKRAVVGMSLTAREEVKNDGIAVSVVYPYITKTDFEKNTLRSEKLDNGHWGDREIPEGDSPEFVAEKILEAITTGDAEIYAHDWMKKQGK